MYRPQITDAVCFAVRRPWVVESMWRTVFPSLYLQRFAFFRTPCNAILTDRCFAFVGEMGWVAQAALGLAHVDRETSARGKGRPLVQLSAILAVAIYAVAEGEQVLRLRSFVLSNRLHQNLTRPPQKFILPARVGNCHVRIAPLRQTHGVR